MKSIRKTITFPPGIENQIIKFQDEREYATFTQALLELVRLGLKSTVKDDVK